MAARRDRADAAACGCGTTGAISRQQWIEMLARSGASTQSCARERTQQRQQAQMRHDHLDRLSGYRAAGGDKVVRTRCRGTPRREVLVEPSRSVHLHAAASSRGPMPSAGFLGVPPNPALPPNWDYFGWGSSAFSPNLALHPDPLLTPGVGGLDQGSPQSEADANSLCENGTFAGVSFSEWFAQWTLATLLPEFGGTQYNCMPQCQQYKYVFPSLAPGGTDAFELWAGPDELQWIWICGKVEDNETAHLGLSIEYGGVQVFAQDGYALSQGDGFEFAIRARQSVPTKWIRLRIWSTAAEDAGSGLIEFRIVGRLGFVSDPAAPPPWETDL